MNDLYSILGWGSPLGIGLFLVCLGSFIFLLSHANSNRKQSK